MAKAKKKTLPKNFQELIGEGDLAKLQAVFETCDINARGGYAKQTALAFDECPTELACWLVEKGADVSAIGFVQRSECALADRAWREDRCTKQGRINTPGIRFTAL